jgi:hypothetical protein
MTDAQTQFVASCIRARIAAEDPWARVMAALDALHLHADMGGSLLLRPSGEVLELVHDEDTPHLLSPDSFWHRYAYVIASDLYPELASLRPVRPRHARDCSACAATGRLSGTWCGPCQGLGWLS